MQALSKAKAGESYTIKWMFGAKEVLDFLHSRKVEEGSRIYVFDRMKNYVIIRSQGTKFVLGMDAAERIQV